MAIFTVHMKDNNACSALFIKDGFSWAAFLLGSFWLLSKRLWLAFLGYTLISVALAIVARKLGVPPAMLPLVSLPLAFLLGLEASNLQIWKANRQKFEPVGVVQGTKIDDAERRFFDVFVEAAKWPWANKK